MIDPVVVPQNVCAPLEAYASKQVEQGHDVFRWVTPFLFSMMRAFASLIRLTGFGDLFLHYVKIVAVLGASAIAATSQIDGMLLFLIVFSISAEVFAFVVNDLSDVQVDSMNINTRNPLAAGMMDKRTATSVAIIFLIISVSVLMLLPSRIVLLGIAGLFLSLTYSWRIRSSSGLYLMLSTTVR